MVDVSRVVDLITSAERAIVLTGAGMSTASGIPDYRSSGGREDGRTREFSSVADVHDRPREYWQVTWGRIRELLDARPNQAHKALTALQGRGVLSAVITQNIDGLHQRAGSVDVVEMHGSYGTARCTWQCPAEYTLAEARAMRDTTGVPRCPVCSWALRPNVVMFGESLQDDHVRAARDACRDADLVLIAGTTLLVPPCSELPALARSHGARTVVLNRAETTEDDQATAVLRGPLEVVLPAIAAAIT
jgi:NAD-dependent deacetylase